MREYEIARAEGAADWSAVPELAIDREMWGEVEGVRAWAQIAWGEAALHVRMRAQEREIRAAHPADAVLGMPCEDSCLEFFFAPLEGDERYFNFEFNPNGCMYLGIGSGRTDHVRLLPSHPNFAPRAFRTADGWGIEYQIPYQFISEFFAGFTAAAGTKIRANCYKCGDRTARPHYLAWNPCTSPTPDFHRPCDFGIMRLK